MLQRSPSYVVARPRATASRNRLRRVCPTASAYALDALEERSARQASSISSRGAVPSRSKQRLIAMAARAARPAAATSTPHFTPRYKPVGPAPLPGARRRSVSPRSAPAAPRSSPTRIDRFTGDGIRLASGDDASAPTSSSSPPASSSTLLGDIALTRRRRSRATPSEAMVYKGMMLSDVPNLALCLRLHQCVVDAEGRPHRRLRLPPAAPHGPARRAIVVPRARPVGRRRSRSSSFTSGYVQRASAILPKQGTRRPWQVHQNYFMGPARAALRRASTTACCASARRAQP